MADFLDPRRTMILAECRRRGLKVEPVGQAFRVSGPGICLLVADVLSRTPADLRPYLPQKQLSD